jgi:hypothetical protein
VFFCTVYWRETGMAGCRSGALAEKGAEAVELELVGSRLLEVEI